MNNKDKIANEFTDYVAEYFLRNRISTNDMIRCSIMLMNETVFGLIDALELLESGENTEDEE